MSGEPTEPGWIKPDKISEALNALQRDVTGPAKRVTAFPLLDLGDDVANETMLSLKGLVGGLPENLAAHSGGFATEVTKAGLRVIAADQRGGK